MITVVDYGLGNISSIKTKIERLKFHCIVTSDPQQVAKASKIILPGVGHFAEGIKNIHELGLIGGLQEKVLINKTPILGICLGMQLFTSHSEEGNQIGLNWIKGNTRKFNFRGEAAELRIPHVGWDLIDIQHDCCLFQNIPKDSRFYFTHSYSVHCEDRSAVAATTTYGYTFDSVLAQDNIYATQFHPEKSHQVGLKVIENFLKYA